MNRSSHIARVLVWVTAVAALIPMARLTADWVEISRVLTEPVVEGTERGFDWVSWRESEGVIYAAYVLPHGPAAEAGIRSGDVFFMLEYQQFFNVEDLERAIEGIPPGATRTYFVQRGGEFVEATVRFTRYPTFLYPLSGTLWHFSVWGFLIAGFIHVIGLIIVGPLALRSRKAQFSLLLILASSLWIFSNLGRLLMIEFLGPPLEIGSTYDRIFQALTVIGLIGWIGFPALLLHNVLVSTQSSRKSALGFSRFVIYLPAAVLGFAALSTTVRGSMGPVTIDGLAAPILFYACCYVAASAVLMLIHLITRSRRGEDQIAGWSRIGSVVMLAIALLFGLSVLGIVPIFGVVTETIAGWLIVAAQLVSVAPVVLVSHATLQHGKIDQVLSRAIMYLTVSGVVFFAFVGGLSLLESYATRIEASLTVIAGLYAVVLLFGVEWMIRRFKVGMSLFAGQRRAMYRAVQLLQEQMRGILDYDTLVQRTIDVVGREFGARAAVLFVRPGGSAGPWYTGNYHPEPPYFTERLVTIVWPHLESGRVWARNPELNESRLPDEIHKLLLSRGTAIVVPIMGKDAPVGILALGMKKHRRSVYNLEEVDLLKSLSGQLALAVDRLSLVERERALIRESAEAQLVALRAQINPHFLFNALNTIISLIAEKPDEAEEVVEHLAAIFRYILKTGGLTYVTVEEEFELIKHYLSIERSRFGGALQVEDDMDPSCRHHPVPAFAVQTLVENAVKHGLAKRRGGGTLRLICRRASDFIEIEISDTGVGIPHLFDVQEVDESDRSFYGIGLKNVTSRLEQLYGRSDLLHLRSNPDEGTIATLRIPVEQPILEDETVVGAEALDGESETNGRHVLT